MFQGTMIEELINSVERAEQNARERENAVARELRAYPLQRMQWHEVIEVA